MHIDVRFGTVFAHCLIISILFILILVSAYGLCIVTGLCVLVWNLGEKNNNNNRLYINMKNNYISSHVRRLLYLNDLLADSHKNSRITDGAVPRELTPGIRG